HGAPLLANPLRIERLDLAIQLLELLIASTLQRQFRGLDETVDLLLHAALRGIQAPQRRQQIADLRVRLRCLVDVQYAGRRMIVDRTAAARLLPRQRGYRSPNQVDQRLLAALADDEIGRGIAAEHEFAWSFLLLFAFLLVGRRLR